jgi:hypothetical protein
MVGPTHCDRGLPGKLNPQIGFVDPQGPVRPHQLLETLPGNLLALYDGGRYIPGCAAGLPCRPQQLDECHLGLAEPPAGHQDAEALIAENHLSLRASD